MSRMPSATVARARRIAADLDALTREVQDLFDDACAEAHGLILAEPDYLDGLHDAACSAAMTTTRLRAAIDA